MRVKFKAGRTTKALAGLKRTCVRFQKVETRDGMALRCAEFKARVRVGKHPYCPKGSRLKARDSRGKSPGLIRVVGCKARRKRR